MFPADTCKQLTTLLLVVALTVIGCSQGASPATPSLPGITGAAELNQNTTHNLLGLYTFICDPISGRVDVIPLRDADFHLNALKFLEPPPYVNVSIEGTPVFNEGILDVNIGLRHPFLGKPEYTGFDVCGIIFTHGLMTGFNDPEIVMAGEGDTRLLNADGYTRWWNPAEFPHGDTIFNYIDGLLGIPADAADFNCTINGYKYFADGLEKDDPLTALNPVWHGMFQAGQKNVRHYTIDLSGGFIFNYAIDACWQFPTGEPPYNPQTDFPPGANRPEAYNIVITELETDLYYEESTGKAGGDLRLQIDVWDHFNSELNKVYAESLAGLPLIAATAPIGGGEGYSTYKLDFTGEDLTYNGEGELLVTVQSEVSGYGGSLPGKPVSAYFIHTFNINSQSPQGWARTWGGEWNDYGQGVALDNSGFAYVTGRFKKTVDFDPGPGVDEQTSNGNEDIFLSKFDPNGDFIWVRTWGGPSSDRVYCVATDISGNIYVTGTFYTTVDFDPAPGIDEHTSNGAQDVFSCKFSPNGDFIWAQTWGNTYLDYGYGITVSDSDNVYITGSFHHTVDFNPGTENDYHTSSGAGDVYLSKFDSNGGFSFALTWGGEGNDFGLDVAVDNNGDVAVEGWFQDTVDFDPGPGTDIHTPNSLYFTTDIFLSKFDSNGVFKWAQTWSGAAGGSHSGLAVDDSANLYVTGSFYNTVDFDPGPGTDFRVPNGNGDVYLSKFNSDGDFQWVRTWGGLIYDYGTGVDTDNSENIYVTGFFAFDVDFDPGLGVDTHTSNSVWDVFISKFDSSGDFLWARTWGGKYDDHGEGVAVDGSSNVYITGRFGDTVDFDPGPGGEYHTSNGHDDAFLSKFPPDGNW